MWSRRPLPHEHAGGDAGLRRQPRDHGGRQFRRILAQEGSGGLLTSRADRESATARRDSSFVAPTLADDRCGGEISLRGSSCPAPLASRRRFSRVPNHPWRAWCRRTRIVCRSGTDDVSRAITAGDSFGASLPMSVWTGTMTARASRSWWTARPRRTATRGKRPSM
jgi:hypothetical protein